MQIKQQHLFAFEHALGEGAGFIHLALVVNRVAGVKIMRGIDVELPLAVAAQHHADGVDPEVAIRISFATSLTSSSVSSRESAALVIATRMRKLSRSWHSRS